MLGRLARDMRVRVGALVCACFLLATTGWLSWLRGIMALAEPSQVDFFTMVVGYLFQAVGIGLFMGVARRRSGEECERAVAGSLVAGAVLLYPATMSASLGTSLLFGWLTNACYGMLQGFYLMCVAELVDVRHRGTVFGVGYAVSTIATWTLSSIGGGALVSGLPCIVTCCVLSLLSYGLVRSVHVGLLPGGDAPRAGAARDGGADASFDRSLLALACATVVLVSLVKNAGFSFPAEDLSGVVDLELSRLFYGVGLAVAGMAADRDRRNALGFCAASLAVPFLMLALIGADVSGVALWAIGYLLYGFFTVFRVLLLADLASDARRPWLAGAGLLAGRVGDALGTMLCLACGSSPVTLILITAVLFAASMRLLFALYQRLHSAAVEREQAELREQVELWEQAESQPQELPQPQLPSPERDMLGEFCAAYSLSAREREVLPLLIAGKTNAEIAAELFVAESTVKYHVRNILTKTGCNSRLKVSDLYIESLR